jgi:4-carboxymuconolactone decarboxylase
MVCACRCRTVTAEPTEESQVRHGRLPWPTPDELDVDEREFYDAIVGGTRSTMARATPLTDDDGRLHGPFNTMLTNPTVGIALQSLGASLRFAGVLPKALFELLVLIVAVERQASYEWYAHAPIGQQAGLTDDDLATIRDGGVPASLSAEDRAVVDLALTTLRHEEPTEALVREVEATYGAAGVTETVTVIAYYDLLATLMRTWATPLPDGVPDPLA